MTREIFFGGTHIEDGPLLIDTITATHEECQR